MHRFLACGAIFFLVSCSQATPWSINHIKTGNACFDSSELCYRSSDPANGLDLEMIRTQESLRLYLSVRSRIIPPYKNNPQEAIVEVLANGEKHRFIAFRHEGGQRVLLPEECQNLILSQLKDNHPVAISLSGYKNIIEPTSFSSFYEQLYNPPYSHPFRLPF